MPIFYFTRKPTDDQLRGIPSYETWDDYASTLGVEGENRDLIEPFLVSQISRKKVLPVVSVRISKGRHSTYTWSTPREDGRSLTFVWAQDSVDLYKLSYVSENANLLLSQPLMLDMAQYNDAAIIEFLHLWLWKTRDPWTNLTVSQLQEIIDKAKASNSRCRLRSFDRVDDVVFSWENQEMFDCPTDVNLCGSVVTEIPRFIYYGLTTDHNWAIYDGPIVTFRKIIDMKRDRGPADIKMQFEDFCQYGSLLLRCETVQKLYNR